MNRLRMYSIRPCEKRATHAVALGAWGHSVGNIHVAQGRVPEAAAAEVNAAVDVSEDTGSRILT